MKIKITYTILIIAFLISVTSCKVDAIPGNTSVSGSSRYCHTEEEIRQVRQNVIGRYQGQWIGVMTTISVNANTIRISSGLTITESTYTLSYSRYLGRFTLRFQRDQDPYFFDVILLGPGSNTQVVGLRPGNDSITYFGRLQGDQEAAQLQEELQVQNLIGRYRGMWHGSMATIDISADTIRMSNESGLLIAESDCYAIRIVRSMVPVLRFYMNNRFMEFDIVLRPGNNTQIMGLRRSTASMAYFPRVEDRQEAPQIEVSPVHQYTNVERRQIERNLLGRYRGIFNDRPARLDIRADDNTIYIIINGEERTFRRRYITYYLNGEVSIVFSEEDTLYEFQILFDPDNPIRIVGLRSKVHPTLSSFRKLGGDLYPPHPEL